MKYWRNIFSSYSEFYWTLWSCWIATREFCYLAHTVRHLPLSILKFWILINMRDLSFVLSQKLKKKALFLRYSYIFEFQSSKWQHVQDVECWQCSRMLRQFFKPRNSGVLKCDFNQYPKLQYERSTYKLFRTISYVDRPIWSSVFRWNTVPHSSFERKIMNGEKDVRLIWFSFLTYAHTSHVHVTRQILMRERTFQFYQFYQSLLSACSLLQGEEDRQLRNARLTVLLHL